MYVLVIPCRLEMHKVVPELHEELGVLPRNRSQLRLFIEQPGQPPIFVGQVLPAFSLLKVRQKLFCFVRGRQAGSLEDILNNLVRVGFSAAAAITTDTGTHCIISSNQGPTSAVGLASSTS